MIRHEIKGTVRRFAEGIIDEQEFKQQLISLTECEGGNYYTVSGALSGILDSPYTHEFRDRVKDLALDADPRFRTNLSDGGGSDE